MKIEEINGVVYIDGIDIVRHIGKIEIESNILLEKNERYIEVIKKLINLIKSNTLSNRELKKEILKELEELIK